MCLEYAGLANHLWLIVCGLFLPSLLWHLATLGSTEQASRFAGLEKNEKRAWWHYVRLHS